MSLESLSSEIFFEIFDFLDHTHILHAFHNLNNRFNHLILNYFHVSPQLNLQSITKTDFDITCQYYIPLLTDKIQSLCLSNDDNTPQQIDLFLSYDLSLHKFTYLKSLSLYNMHSEQIINRMMIEWKYPIHLTHLNIINCQILSDWNIFYSLINNIWSLPKLTHCQLDIKFIDDIYFFVPTVISSTLKSLSIKNAQCNFEELIHLFEYTPCLEYLDITIIEKNANHPYLTFSIPLLTTLKLNYKGPISALKNLLQNVLNLHHWSMKTKNINIDGQQWADIISTYLSRLKVFHLLMEFDKHNGFFPFKDIIDTFTSDFWLNKHRWYVQGNRYGYDVFFVYTIPYSFNDYSIPSDKPYSRKETYYSNFQDGMLYDNVHYLSCDSFPKFQFYNRFPHLHHLAIALPLIKNFWTFVPTFDQLRRLDISLSHKRIYHGDTSCQLQAILERAPKLTTLTIKSSIASLLPLLESTSKSIIKLDLQSLDQYFNHSDCATLFLSSLGKQCKILSIAVANQMNILQLVKEMPQLQTLNVKHPYNRYRIDSSSASNNQFIKWLRHQLPSTSTITRDPICPNKIRLWIR